MRVEITPLPKCWYLKQEYNQNNVNLPPGYFEHARSNFQFIEKSQTSVSFLGSDKKEPAKLWRVKIQDKIINLGFPKGNTPSEEKMYEEQAKNALNALSTLNKKNIESVDTVIINPYEDPYNYEEMTLLGEAIDKNIYIYKSGAIFSKIQSTIIHESGHTLLNSLGDQKEVFLNKWEIAMKNQNGISRYAETSSEQDFCESLVGYIASQDTECEKEFIKMYPEKHKLLIQILNKK